MAVFGAACSGGRSKSAEGTPDCSPPVAVTQIPTEIASLGLERWGIVTKAESRAGFLGAEAVSEQEVVEIYPDAVRRLSGSYTFLGGENEGFEAELSFADRKGRVASFTLTEVECDRVLIQVLFEKGGA
jgi:hypothetical protein